MAEVQNFSANKVLTGARPHARPTCNTTTPASRSSADTLIGAHTMQLGNFSVSLAVKDLQKSRAFYEALGFTVTGGDEGAPR